MIMAVLLFSPIALLENVYWLLCIVDACFFGKSAKEKKCSTFEDYWCCLDTGKFDNLSTILLGILCACFPQLNQFENESYCVYNYF